MLYKIHRFSSEVARPIDGMTGRTVDFAIERVGVDGPMQTSMWCSLVDVRPAGEFRRQIEAG